MDNQAQTHLPDLSPYAGYIIIAAVIVFLFFFPYIASLVAPEDRRLEFFILTLLVLWGPIGVACAAIANPRPESDD